MPAPMQVLYSHGRGSYVLVVLLNGCNIRGGCSVNGRPYPRCVIGMCNMTNGFSG
jgi:hypothetical protein